MGEKLYQAMMLFFAAVAVFMFLCLMALIGAMAWRVVTTEPGSAPATVTVTVTSPAPAPQTD